jgi:hypothetical protein
MPRKKKKTASWRTSLSSWVKGVGAGNHTSYNHTEFGNAYEIEPVEVSGRIFYHVAFSAGRASPKVRYLNDEGAVIDVPLIFRSPDAARLAAVRNYDKLRRTKHHAHMLTHSFGTRSRKI